MDTQAPATLPFHDTGNSGLSGNSATPGTSILLRGVSKRFPGMDRPALAPLDWEIHPGAITGLAGSDGAGKSTLLRMLAGLLQADGGLVRVAGLDPIAGSAALRALLGYMPQRFGLYEDLTVQENLELYAALRGVEAAQREAAFEKLLDFTSLHPFTKRLAGKLSGGMKQKLGLACTLLGTPRVLLLDEPGVGVDPLSRRELWSMVRRLSDDGMLIIWSTSYLDEAERCATVLLLNEGEALYTGPPAALTERMTGRSFLARLPQGGSRKLLQQAVTVEGVRDALIQGDAVRLVLADTAQPGAIAARLGLTYDAPPHDGVAYTTKRSANNATGLDILPRTPHSGILPGTPHSGILLNTPPRFEDAFIDLLGGGASGRSGLTDSVPDNVPGTAPKAEAAKTAKPAKTAKAGTPANTFAPDAPVIEARDLTRVFGDFVATDHVNFTVRRGEIFGLLGPNGAGKSTTFKMMCGLLKPSSGQALVLGMDLQRQPGRVRQRLGYMAQKFSLYGNLNVRQNLEFFSGVYGLTGSARRQRVDEMVESFHLAPYLHQPSGGLPPGYRQRLALACSLMHRPDILFLDEPTSGVDALTRREFWLHINSMVEQGITVMVTTHFMDEAEYCDRIGLVYHGKLIAQGSPDELKARVARPATPATALPGDTIPGDTRPGAAMPGATMEDAFIYLVESYDQAEKATGGSA